ncbi:MFS transporter [Actinoplanes sp. Pm04-4]|uniref:MFS transporter n=1 Tax=Paractinoplanes pyxinae TaxID=2997416 RepID=A0ABT4BFT3_9ACTN|nr:MFS transporter [Actinoplanes pyxinae]MCY1144405.1 MFS transporter [Actinoplanes pyxinae]
MPKGRTIALLRSPNILRLLAALAASRIGDWAFNTALIAVVYERTHSAGWLAATAVARIGPVVVLGPIGGSLADRFDRRRLLIGADLYRAAIMAAAAYAVVAELPVAVLLVLTAMTTAASAPFDTALAALVPRLAEKDQLNAANSARAAVTEVSSVLGPLVFAIGYGRLSDAGPFLVNAASFLVSAAFLVQLKGIGAPPADREPEARSSLLQDVVVGWQAIRGRPAIWRLAGADILESAIFGSLTVLLLLLSHRLTGGDAAYGTLMAATGIGGGAAAFGTAWLGRRFRPLPLVRTALLATAVPLLLLGFWTDQLPIIMAAVLAAVLGGANVVAEIQCDSALQTQLDDEVLGRAFGLVLPACMLAVVIGTATAQLLADALSLPGAFLLLGVLVLLYIPVATFRQPTVAAPPAKAELV